ncbi:D-alanyl-D-alanine carboxypeptidase family protein [Stappia sp. ICDLI1TA098]
MLFAAAACLALLGAPAFAQGTQGKGADDDATASLLLDLSTGTLLSSTNATVSYAPGSTAKLVTAAVAFDALKDGDIDLATKFKVSEHAWRTGGAPARVTTMFAALNSEVSVEDLLKGLIVQSANDAAIVLAEGLAGSEEAFAARMNAFAERIGMTQSHFSGPTGHIDASAHTTARDMARLASYLLERHPDRLPLFSLPDFTWNGIFQRNKNPLIGAIADLDGFIAGQSARAGYNAVGTMERKGRRLVGIVAGQREPDALEKALADLFDSLERDYEEVVLYGADEVIAEARVFGGTLSSTALESREPVQLLLPRGDKRDYRLRVVYSGPLQAPVAKGQEVGELRVLRDGTIVYRAGLHARDAVPAGTVTSRATDVLRETLFGWWLDGG